MYGRGSDPGMEPCRSRVRQNPDATPAASQRPACGVGVSTHRGAAWAGGTTVFVLGLSALYIDVRIYSPGGAWFHERQPVSGYIGEVGLSTSCGAVWTRGCTIHVPGLSEL